MTDTREILELIDALPESDQRAVFASMRQSIPIHGMEKTLMAPAEAILEAAARSRELTARGIEPLIGKASFAVEVIPTLTGMIVTPVDGGEAYDFLLGDAAGKVRVQVKMQCHEKRRPWMASEVQRKREWAADHFVVETQRTRVRKRSDLAKTRPYRFGSFDILAVSMGASQGRWSAFMYTVERWLLPAEYPFDVLAFQPIPPSPTDCWTEDFLECVRWFRSGTERKIPG